MGNIKKNEILFWNEGYFQLKWATKAFVNLEENWYNTNPSNVAIKILLKFSFSWFQISQQQDNDSKLLCCNQN